MRTKLPTLQELRPQDNNSTSDKFLSHVSHQDIAIIGMASKIADTNNIDEYWDMLKDGKDCVRNLPDSRRKDVKDFLSSQGITSEDSYDFRIGAYMHGIDHFDYDFFSMSAKEAKLMDPHQKILLENVYTTIEDAGYSHAKIAGSRTGVYIGWYMGDNFKRIYEESEAYIPEFLITGNIASNMAGRISYLLDLKGPSLVVDTACSSSLCAVHTACRDIRSGQCDQALACSVRVYFLPTKNLIKPGLGFYVLGGVESKDQKSKTFDESADGLGLGEGVVSILLKPLSKAIQDRDHIYAVIKGSASNHDGKSIGLGAPNAEAQMNVIQDAWKDANINPETISYIETHGTGTKLGDPVEIKGLEMAFRNYTRKKQFCAIGSVKPNIGHLDVASGLASIVKTALALKHGKIPPSIHFERPNKRIKFESSPVYINDTLTSWKTTDLPRRCGISSFGLSGTNYHLVLEEAPSLNPEKNVSSIVDHNYFFCLSAKNPQVLSEYVERYALYFNADGQDDSLQDICYTAHTGRAHLGCRLAIIASNKIELQCKLEKLMGNGLRQDEDDGIYLQESRLLSPSQQQVHQQGVSIDQQTKLGRSAEEKILGLFSKNYAQSKQRTSEICRLYLQGADIDWQYVYSKHKGNKLRLPTYPFAKTRCWIHDFQPKINQMPVDASVFHPLLDQCLLDSKEQIIYETTFNIEKHWVLAEHKITGYSIIPGVTYMEMLREIGKRHYSGQNLRLSAMFLTPLLVEDDTDKQAKVVIRKEHDRFVFRIETESRHGDKKVIHCEGDMQPIGMNNPPIVDLEALKNRFYQKDIIKRSMNDLPDEIFLGPRWGNFDEIYYDDHEYFVPLELPVHLAEDLDQYGLHPALMDNAVNALWQNVGDGIYLPLSYKVLEIYGTMPRSFYSHLKRKDKNGYDSETATFNIDLIDEQGKVFARCYDYTIKKVHQTAAQIRKLFESSDILHELTWVPQDGKLKKPSEPDGAVLIFCNTHSYSQKLAALLSDAVVITLSDKFSVINETEYTIGRTEDDYRKLFEHLKINKISMILHTGNMYHSDQSEELSQLESKRETGVFSLFYLVRTLINNKVKGDLRLFVLADYVHEVTKSEVRIIPQNAQLVGFCKVIQSEYPHIHVRCIDCDEQTEMSQILVECNNREDGLPVVAFRENVRYVEQVQPLTFSEHARKGISLKEGGVYIITGGLGGIGLEVAKYITSQKRSHIIMLNRSEFPKRSLWNHILSTNDDKRLCDKFKAINDIEKQGSDVSLYSVDVSSLSDMRDVIKQIRDQFKTIDGVIHSAGIAGDGFIINKDKQVMQKVLSPKVEGTIILDQLTEQDNLDFFILFSSLSTLTGLPGQSDYTAANAYLDAYAHYRNKRGRKTITINWPAWTESGMALDYGTAQHEFIFNGVTNREGIEAFADVIRECPTRVLVGAFNFDKIISEKDIPIKLSHDLRRKISAKNKEHSHLNQSVKIDSDQRVAIIGQNNDCLENTEVIIGRIWSKLLDLEEVDVYENFNDVGGDSLLATQLFKEIDSHFPGVVDISDIFSYSTISSMAKYIDSKTAHKTEYIINQKSSPSINEVLQKLADGEYSVNDVDNILNLEDDALWN